jgi:hypothetical protein
MNMVILFLTLIFSGLSAGNALAQMVACNNENNAVPATTPVFSFTDHGDGTVTHNATGLMWMRCSLGQTWISGCTGTVASYSWKNSLEAVRNLNSFGGFAGHADWRLPNKNELASIVEDRCWTPAINGSVFPDTPSGRFWSSSPYDAGNAWFVGFQTGGVVRDNMDFSYNVRLVRGGR